MEPLELRLLLSATFSFNAPSGNGADDFKLLFNVADDRYEIRDSVTNALLAKRNHTNGLGSVNITGAGGEGDTLRIASSFFSNFPLPVTFAGGTGGPDALIVLGTGTSTATYAPAAGTAGAGTVAVSGTQIVFAGLEPVTVSGMASLVVVTPGSEDNVTIDTAGPAANVIEGTSDGVAFESITFFDVTDVTLDTAAHDGAMPDDTVTFLGDLIASGLGSFTVDLGEGDDFADASAVSSLGVTLLGGAGDDLLDDGGAEAPLGDLLDAGDGNNTIISLQGGNDTLIGGANDDIYDVTHGSTKTISDPGGDDEVDFGAGMMTGGGTAAPAALAAFAGIAQSEALPPGIELNIDDNGCIAHGNGGAVICFGEFETFFTTDGPDVITVQTNTLTVTVSGGKANDEYFEEAGPGATVHFHDPLPPGMGLPLVNQAEENGGDDTYHFGGSTVTGTDDGGNDEVDFGMMMTGGTATSATALFANTALAPQTSQSVGLCLVSGWCIDVTDSELTAVNGDGASITLVGTFETVSGSDDDDIIDLLTSAGTHTTARGLNGDDLINSGPGSDTLDGGAGNDTMNGGTGDDTFVQTNLQANPGTVDEISDGGGLETIDFSGSALGVIFDLNDFGTLVVDAAGNVVNLVGSAFLENVIATNFDDNVTGSDLPNFISTLDGDDRIVGAGGFDVLIGGHGADRINGSSGEDLIISGYSDFDTNDEALRAILAEWTSGADLETRVENLRNGSITLSDGTAVVLDKDVTVFDDNDADRITASNGPDWIFFDDLLDTVTDLDPGEDVINDGPVPLT